MLELFCLFMFIEIAGAACPATWVAHGQSCYYFSRDAETWPDAYTICKIFGGKLAEIEDSDEDNFIGAEAKLSNNNPIAPFRQSYWIGLSDVSEEGTWLWMLSKKNLSGRYSNWYPGQPGIIGSNFEQENCADLHHLTGKWNDAVCSEEHYFICEKNTEMSVAFG